MRWLRYFRKWLKPKAEGSARADAVAVAPPASASESAPDVAENAALEAATEIHFAEPAAPQIVAGAPGTDTEATAASAPPSRLSLDLALQGGGAHGAFTWGVLDRLLDEPRLDLRGISGTSAGALNGAMLVSGHAQGGRAGAQKRLREFWQAVGDIGSMFAPFQSAINGHGQGAGLLDAMTRMWSPYQLNPFNLNPLRDVLERLLDVDALRNNAEMQLFVTATNVHTGQPRIVDASDLSIDALLASACLPFLYRAVEIDGVPYWDGGYAGNPVIWPLIYKTQPNDILLVQINPLMRETTPSSASEIIDRVNEITFNAPLIAEMRAIDFVGRLLKERRLDSERYRQMHMHMIDMHTSLDGAVPGGKLQVDNQFFETLHDHGHRAADAWLKRNRRHIGKESTLDIRKTFLGPREPGDSGVR